MFAKLKVVVYVLNILFSKRLKSRVNINIDSKSVVKNNFKSINVLSEAIYIKFLFKNRFWFFGKPVKLAGVRPKYNFAFKNIVFYFTFIQI